MLILDQRGNRIHRVIQAVCKKKMGNVDIHQSFKVIRIKNSVSNQNNIFFFNVIENHKFGSSGKKNPYQFSKNCSVVNQI